MRIALITRRWDPEGGGTERDLVATARALRDAGHAISIYAGEVRAAPGEWSVVRVGVRLPSRAVSILRFGFAAPAAARRAGADLTISFARSVGANVLRSGGGAHSSYLRAAARWRGSVRASLMRIQPYHRAQMFLERRGFRSRRLKLAIAVSDFVRADLISAFGISRSKVVTLYNGVDLDHFKPATSAQTREDIRREFKLPASSDVVLFVGNGFGRKGLGALIEAWPIMPRRPFLLVVGADREMNRYRARADALGVGPLVTFAGAQADPARFFHASDLLALPSYFEPFGNVAMEALASGVPAITSAMCGVTEILPEAMRRYRIADPGDAGEVALRIGAILDAAPALARTARDGAEKFTWERHTRELLAIVEAAARG
jgi:UDP-glucose:(heptosyl)LPS alpha-1,3-glucosyltransferase